MKKSLLVVATIAALASAFGTYAGILYFDPIATESITSTIKTGDESIQGSVNEVRRMQEGSLELAFTDFEPELLYRIDFVSRDDEPNSIFVEIENTGNHHTAVHNTWTITGNFCSSDNRSHYLSFSEVIHTSHNLTKQNPFNETRIFLSDFLFDDLEEKRSFLIMLELEMIPFTPSAGMAEALSVPRKTFIQFDHNEGEYPDWWMLRVNRVGDLNCDTESSIWTHVNLNTTNIEDFDLRPRG